MPDNNYIDILKKARADGLIISKEYLKFATESYGTLNKHAPSLWKVIMSKRYMLPDRLQSDYVKQELCDYLFLDFILAYSLGALPEDDDVTHVSYISAVRALEFDRPTYYLERSLAEALVRTDVPLDLRMDDIHWIYPQFRIYLPNNLIAITRRGKPNPAMFIDVCKVEDGIDYAMPRQFQKELFRVGAMYFPNHNVPSAALILNATLHFDSEESNINYAVTTPWKGSTMRDTIDVGNGRTLQSSLTNDELDHAFMSRVMCLAINVMLRLSSLPVEAQQTLRAEPAAIRKPKQEGKRTIVGLYPAKIIGMGDDAKPTKLSVPSEPTGKHLVAHWRRGHWRRQPYGPKAGLRRFQWVAPYHTYER